MHGARFQRRCRTERRGLPHAVSSMSHLTPALIGPAQILSQPTMPAGPHKNMQGLGTRLTPRFSGKAADVPARAHALAVVALSFPTQIPNSASSAPVSALSMTVGDAVSRGLCPGILSHSFTPCRGSRGRSRTGPGELVAAACFPHESMLGLRAPGARRCRRSKIWGFICTLRNRRERGSGRRW